MKLALLTGIALALAGCSTVTQEKVLTNLEGCKRVYKGAIQGGVLGGGFIGSVDVTCDPKDDPEGPSK